MHGLYVNGFPERWIIKLPRCLPSEKSPTFASCRTVLKSSSRGASGAAAVARAAAAAAAQDGAPGDGVEVAAPQDAPAAQGAAAEEAHAFARRIALQRH